MWSCPSCEPRVEHLKMTDQAIRSGWAVLTVSSQDRTHDKCFTVRALSHPLPSSPSPSLIPNS
jgi:hypothetical protein